MAWTTVSSVTNRMVSAHEQYTLPNATTAYSTAITPTIMEPRPDKQNHWVTFGFNASAVTGTNLDIGLYGVLKSGGSKVLLKDAVVADITATGLVQGQIDLNAYPAIEYYLGWIADADETSNTIDVYINAPA